MSTALADPPVARAVPPLRDGERLGRAEFLRRWDALPNLKRAERIEGVVRLMASPVSIFDHAVPTFQLGGWLQNYADATLGTCAYGNGTTLLDIDNDFQPDAALIVLPEYGGATRPRGKFLAGAPELVAEISASTAARDRGAKKEVYRRNGTLEYLNWRTVEGAFEAFMLDDDGAYLPMPLDDGVWKSRAFPGLWIHAAALLAGDRATCRAVAAAGLESPERAAFAAALAARR